MSDPQFPDVVYSNVLPSDTDQPYKMPATLAAPMFLALNRAMTIGEFLGYVATYDFGAIPPDFIVFHHTAVPSASWGPLKSDTYPWDAGETGMDEDTIRRKRTAQLNGIRNYYRDVKKWDRGPHLFIDDRWVWLFTPMYEIGIHAAEGNSNNHGGRLHYSLGIEIIGYHEKVTWHPNAERMAGLVVAALQKRLGTFDLVYAANEGHIGAHRLYNKPSCPGAAITKDYLMQVCQQGVINLKDMQAPKPVPLPSDLPTGTFPVDPRFIKAWNSSGGVWKATQLTPGFALTNAFLYHEELHQVFERGVARLSGGTVVWLLATEWSGVFHAAPHATPPTTLRTD